MSQGVDDDTQSFYSKGNMAPLIGESDFKDYVYEELFPSLEAESKVRVICPDMDIEDIAGEVAQAYQTTVDAICTVMKGPQKGSEARKMAMYLCQEVGSAKLADIASYFSLSHSGSVSYITHQVRCKRREDSTFGKRVDHLLKGILCHLSLSQVT